MNNTQLATLSKSYSFVVLADAIVFSFGLQCALLFAFPVGLRPLVG